MRTLLPTLLDYDPGLVEIIANRWDVDLDGLDRRTAAETLTNTMLDPDYAAAEWARLSDAERGALQMLLSTADHRMTQAQYSRLFGELRQMGQGRRDREKPHLNPVGVAEVLYYRGLVALAIDQGRGGAESFVYVPSDLAAVLPAHETGFNLDQPPDWSAVEAGTPAQVIPANTTLVDDMTTLLAFLRMNPVPAEPEALHAQVSDALADSWLSDGYSAWVALLLALASGSGLATNQGGQFVPVAAHARRWLEDTRPRQVRALAQAWRDSTLFNDLWYTPGLVPENTGWRNEPVLARETVLDFLKMVQPDDWWPIADLIAQVKAEDADFQRPGGDYASWYIRDAATGEYLRGFESWDQVDGALLHFILTGPMHWLGLMDVGDGGRLARLTVYGRAICEVAEWPDPAEESARPELQNDGTILASRLVSRYERFQLARFTEWGPPGDPYVYAITAMSLQQAARQELPLDAIRAFLRRTSGADLPAPIEDILQQFEQTRDAEVRLTQGVVLRAPTEEMFQVILETPELRRYLGAPLGPQAVFVRADQADDLAAALRQRGILVEFEND